MVLSVIRMKAVCLACAILALSMVPDRAAAAAFTVTDGDFVGGVYEFRFYPRSNKLVINGNTISNPPPASLTLTNNGWTALSGDYGYWEATGTFSAVQLAGALTMGWDMTAISWAIANVELRTHNHLFQFSPWTAHALGDKIFADLATPSAFGSGPYTNLYSFTGDGNTEPIGSADVFSIASTLPAGWLSDPGLLELRFGYQQHAIDAAHPNIPGRHIQLFRDSTGSGQDGFLFRVTLVPEPSVMALLALGGLTLFRRRRL